MELHVDHMIDGYGCSALPLQRLLALQARRRAWSDPALAASRRITLLPGRESRCTLNHGILTRLVDTGNANMALAQQDIGCDDKCSGTSTLPACCISFVLPVLTLPTF